MISGVVENSRAGGSRVFGPGDVLFASPSRAEITQAHIATESVKLSDAVVDFRCENLRRFAEHLPLLGMVGQRAG